MNWEKQGLIFEPDRTKPWSRSHAALPVILPLTDDRWRVFFSSRDAEQRSYVGWFEIDPNAPTVILAVSPEPILTPGPMSHFDADGIYVASAVADGDHVKLYTIGWNKGVPHPLFRTAIGLATSSDGGNSVSWRSKAPVMDRSEYDPSLVSAPFVLRDQGQYRMWYISGDTWDVSMQSYYNIKYAHSDDGRAWQREGVTSLPNLEGEPNIARLCVVPHGGEYYGWFSSTQGGQYRIRHARSKDGLTWERVSSGPDVSPSGWDSEAVTYPAVQRHRDRWLMFYNGNSFGRDGIGLAISQG